VLTDARPHRHMTKPAAAFLAGALFALTACGSSGRDSGGGGGGSNGDVVVGVILSLSGPVADLAQMNKDGIDLAVSQINAGGGIDGHHVKVIVKDDQASPDKAVIAAQELITQDHVAAIIGATTGSSSLAIKPLFAKVKLPLLTPVATAALTEPKDDYVFRAMINDDQAVQSALALIAKKWPGQKVGIIHDDSALAVGSAAAYKKNAPKFGVNIVSSEQFAATDTDMTTPLTKLKALGPAVIVDIGYSPSAFTLLRNVKQLGMSAAFVGSTGMPRAATLTVSGGASDGIIVPTLIDPGDIQPSQKTFADAFYKAHPNRKPDKDPTLWDVISYDSMELVAQAVHNGGGASKSDIYEGLQKIDGYAGVSGTYSFTGGNRDGITDISAVKWMQVKSGKFVPFASGIGS
jgi:branched-chain amino acid transport system substrate-binding protein